MWCLDGWVYGLGVMEFLFNFLSMGKSAKGTISPLDGRRVIMKGS